MSEVEETEDDHKRKVQLLAAILNKRGKEALSLIKEGVDIDYQDETGSYPLHHAATAGLDDVIEALLEKNAKLESADKAGLTALHKAVMCGHVRSIVTLVAWGANVHTPDKRDCFALEYAIQNKDLKIVDLLCQFGTEPLLKDWEWLTTPGVRKRKEDYAMGVTIEKQCILFPGYKHKGITFDIKRITPEDGPVVHLENTRVDVTVPNGQERYYLYLCKKREEYGSPLQKEPDENVFGHQLECQTWGPEVKSITLTLTVDRLLRKNEEVVLWPATKDGSVVINKNDNKSTIVTMTVPLRADGITQFTVISREKIEAFQIFKQAVSLTLESEPEAEINIPADTFKSCELFVKFVDTTEIIEEYEQDQNDKRTPGMPVLMSDILDITTSDHQDPKKEIEIKIPITAKSRSEGIVILKTPNPDPNLLKWEWEEIPAEIKNDKVEFKISHFCRFAAVAQKSLEASPVTATNAVMNASQHNRLVNFLVAVKIPEVNEIQTNMTITCGTKRTINNVKGKYDKSYNCSSLGADLPLAQNGQRFRIVINGEITVESGENIELIFNDKQESSRELENSYTSSDISGTVDIYPVAHYQVPVVEAKCCCYNLCTKKMSVEPYEDKREEKLSTIAFKATLTNQDLGISQQSQPQERPMRTTLSNLPVETLRKHLSRTN